MDNSFNCIAPAGLGAAHVGEINWTSILQGLLKQGFDYVTASKMADQQYKQQLAAIEAAKQAGGLNSGTDDKTMMYVLIGGAVVVALLLTMRK